MRTFHVFVFGVACFCSQNWASQNSNRFSENYNPYYNSDDPLGGYNLYCDSPGYGNQIMPIETNSPITGPADETETAYLGSQNEPTLTFAGAPESGNSQVSGLMDAKSNIIECLEAISIGLVNNNVEKKGNPPNSWTKEDIAKLETIMGKGSFPGWENVAKQFPGRSAQACKRKWEDLPRQKRQQERDNIIINFVEKHGVHNWVQIEEQGISAKYARERWFNWLDPNRNTSPWSEEEDRLLYSLHCQLGSKWVQIAKNFRGRSANSLKNRFAKIRNLYARDSRGEVVCLNEEPVRRRKLSQHKSQPYYPPLPPQGSPYPWPAPMPPQYLFPPFPPYYPR